MSDQPASAILFECPKCRGPVEIPAPQDTAETLYCPHCGGALESRPLARISAKRTVLLIGAFCLLAGVGAIVAIALKRPARQELPTIVAPAPGVVSTNEFTISGLRIEAQGSLRYVQGTVRNDRPEQRYGVTIQLELLDTNEVRVGSASDYRAVVGTNEVWRLRALVVESNAVTAILRAITEAQ